jgi:4-hydroxybenzoate polyprenyltransferase
MRIIALRRLLLIKQTLFGLTWLGAGALLPFLQKNPPLFSIQPWLLMTVAFITARFSGMCFNSLFDRTFDAKNPRTKDRPLPRGEISPTVCGVMAVTYLLCFFAASWAINSLCGLLSFAVGTSVVLYSLTKRITPLCHIALGAIYFFTPFCAWAAIMGEISPIPFFFGLALFLCIAASDIIYACQDIEFDQIMGLYSIPSRIGEKKSLLLAFGMHVMSAVSLFIESSILGSQLLFVASIFVSCVYLFCYMKLWFGQISYMAAFTNINMLSGLILFVFIVAELLF